MMASARMAGIVIIISFVSNIGREKESFTLIIFSTKIHGIIMPRIDACVVEINHSNNLVSDCLKGCENVQMLVLYLRRIEFGWISFLVAFFSKFFQLYD